MRLVDTVIVGNSYLENHAHSSGARNVALIPTVVDIGYYSPKSLSFNLDHFSICWIGSPITSKYLFSISPALGRLCQDDNCQVVLIGSGSINFRDFVPKVVIWDESSEVHEILKCDVGIMPLPDEPWARGKCGLKLIQYMACGLPVVASPVGANTEIVQHGVNGFLASTTREWIEALETLRTDPELRRRMGLAGRKLVEEKYCLEVTAPKYIQIISDAARRVTEGLK